MVSSENGLTNIPEFYIEPIDQDIKKQPQKFFGYYVNSTAPRNVEEPHDVPDIKQLYDDYFNLFLSLEKALKLLLPHILVVLLLGEILLFTAATFKNSYLLVIMLFSVTAVGIICALILLRLFAYSRDSYRATNFGVPDLVELIRQVDQAVFMTKLLDLEINELEALLQPNELEVLFNSMKKTKNETIEQVKSKWKKANTQEKMEYWDQIDNEQALKERVKIETIKKEKIVKKLEKAKIQLNFIGHSMGCFVVTNTIRILSDVFEPNSINKNPSPEVGRVFSLGRLVLVAPDIPVETIMPRRANFLRSSLRRCKEAYIFSNEADIVLRILSTAANYFSFPANTRFGGYRLGNLTANHKERDIKFYNKQDEKVYGIVNYEVNDEKIVIDEPYKHLGIRASDREQQNIKRSESVQQEKIDCKELPKELPAADFFTYFDCTDYIDCPCEPFANKDKCVCEEKHEENQKVVSLASRKSVLIIVDYFWLSFISLIGELPLFKCEYCVKVARY